MDLKCVSTLNEREQVRELRYRAREQNASKTVSSYSRYIIKVLLNNNLNNVVNNKLTKTFTVLSSRIYKIYEERNCNRTVLIPSIFVKN